MPKLEESDFKKVAVGTLKHGDRFMLDDRWYEWQHITAGDSRMIARFLKPDEPYGGKVIPSGHILDPNTQVEKFADYFEEIGKELDEHPIASVRVSRGIDLSDEDFDDLDNSRRHP